MSDGELAARDTIVAEATPAGTAGLSVLRLSGPRAHEVAARIFRPRSSTPPPVRSVAYGHVMVRGVSDEATCVLFERGRSFTGEPVAEIGVHGSPWVVLEVLDACRAAGARLARPGEFTHRAWLEGRLDLARAEALDALIRAASPEAAGVAAAQRSGALAREAEALRDVLLDALAEVEAAIDFHDDSVGQRRIDDALRRASAACEAWQTAARRTRPLLEGFRVVLAGPPNAGKSSLFNRMLREERSIVTEEPGTTRDVLEAHLVVDGTALVLVDTAGERDTRSVAEAEGVRRAAAAREGADLVLQVRDGRSVQQAPDLPAGEHLVLTHRDLTSGDTPAAAWAHVSSTTGAGVDDLVGRLAAVAREATLPAGEGPVLLTARQRDAAAVVLAATRRAERDRAQGLSEEVVAESLREALDGIAELVGAWDREAVYDRVFRRFCVGK